MKCFYHSADLDGHCSGAIVKYFNPECEMIGINYGREFPMDTIQPLEEIYMVDFSLFPFGLMEELNEITGYNFVWIDHHETSIKLDKENHAHIAGIREPKGKAACELTWEYFTDELTPKTVYLLSRYDIWDHKDPWVIPFQYGLTNHNTNPNNQQLWELLFGDDDEVLPLIEKIVDEGTSIYNYIIRDNARYITAHSFVTEFEGYKCLVVNKLNTNSYIFKSVWNPKKHDIMIAFGWSRNKWVVSLYSEGSINVGEIAKKHGGGGHCNAAGFSAKELPFRL